MECCPETEKSLKNEEAVMNRWVIQGTVSDGENRFGVFTNFPRLSKATLENRGNFTPTEQKNWIPDFQKAFATIRGLPSSGLRLTLKRWRHQWE